MIIGFTGTHLGMTHKQKVSLRESLLTVKHFSGNMFHHGDCVGADAEAHDIAEELGFTVYIHPPTDPKKRAFKPSKHVYKKAPYLTRNRHIVDCCHILVAAPDGPERLRSGTWSTVRYARNMKRPVVVIMP